jgi:hypothetical protein
VPDEQQRQDCWVLIDLMRQATGLPPVMWGPAIIGFGARHYRYESGREGDMPLIAFSPRKQNLALYSLTGYHELPALRAQLGKHRTGKGCVYIKRLADVDIATLARLIAASVARPAADPPA